MSKDYFAVLDIETNWQQEMMSVGMVIADDEQFVAVEKIYCIISPECQVGGLYSCALRNVNEKLIQTCTRAEAISNLTNVLSNYHVRSIFSYNAKFDYRFLPELHHYVWHDIMCVAANINTNDKLPPDEEYYRTGLLKRKSFERIMRLIYWKGYTESHNALCDAVDELQLMGIINQKLETYAEYKPSSAVTDNTSAKKQQKAELRAIRNLDIYKDFVEKLCGGAIHLTCVDEQRRIEKFGNASSIYVTYTFHLKCDHCGHQWIQESDIFFDNRSCPNCKKTTVPIE